MLKIPLKPSRLLAAIVLLAHAAAIAVVLIVELPQWLKVVAIALLFAQCVAVVRRQAFLMGATAATAIEITSDHRINVETRAAGWCEYEVLGSTYVTPYLTVLNLRQSDTRVARHVLLLPDSLNADDFRKLRVWLRWKEDSANASKRAENP
ncbi:MAG: protein YgfX [Betaproteobacteria bacterium]